MFNLQLACLFLEIAVRGNDTKCAELERGTAVLNHAFCSGYWSAKFSYIQCRQASAHTFK